MAKPKKPQTHVVNSVNEVEKKAKSKGSLKDIPRSGSYRQYGYY